MRTSLPTVLRPLLAVAASAVLVSGLGGPAHAASTTTTDATGDAVALSGGAASPNNQTADITSLRVTHSSSSVTVVVGLRDLAANNWNLVTAVQTPKARYEVLLADLGGSRYAVLSNKGKAVKCKGLTKPDAAIDTAADALTLVVPRSCLGKPASVRVGAVMTAKQGDTPVADDARLTGKLTSSGKPKLGGKVSAG